jgi:hypothetical protein
MCTSALTGQKSSCRSVLYVRKEAGISQIGARQTYVHWLNQLSDRERHYFPRVRHSLPELQWR